MSRRSSGDAPGRRPPMFVLAATVAVSALLVAGPGNTSAQTANYVVDQFDADTAIAYVNENWGTAVPQITWDGTQNATTLLASNHTGSGSLRWNIPWPGTGDQVEVGRFFSGGTRIDLRQFTGFSFDVMFAPGSALDGNGSYGAIEVDAIPASTGWPSTPLAIYTSAQANGNGWVHVTLPVSAMGDADLQAVIGIGIKIQQSRTGANLTGTTAFWLDNLIFIGSGPSQVIPLNAALAWQRVEFQITNVPAAGNPFDPDSIRLDALFTAPSGRTAAVPAFWYQGYQRSHSGGGEMDVASGLPGWRLRFTPPESGSYSLALTIKTNGILCNTLFTNFSVASNTPSRFGFVGIGGDHRYFQTGDGQALPLNGENVAWDNNGTYDYDTWFASMQGAGENFARVWMSPWCFGIEGNPGTLTNYTLPAAWQLDYVLQLAEQKGIYIQLTLDDYREYSSDPGGDGQWGNNPYNTANGGPCVNANAFFTNSAAALTYEKRLRYLIARYGYSQNLLAWEFFNEIDHDYSYVRKSDVDRWHAQMAGWFHTNDSCQHLVTTSLSYASADPQLWAVSSLDFLSWHTYFSSGYQLNPAATMASDATYYRSAYGKLVQIGEYGTDWHSWPAGLAVDPYLRGLRQGIWGGALGGSAGTAMSWWWDSLAPANDYWLYSSLAAILNPAGWGQGSWTNISVSPGLPLTAIGLSGTYQSLVYVVAADAAWPTGATNASLPVQQNQSLVLENWPGGAFYARWYNPTNAMFLGATSARTVTGVLALPLPDFTEDLAGVIYPAPRLSNPMSLSGGGFTFQFISEIGGKYSIQESVDLRSWTTVLTITNQLGTLDLTNPAAAGSGTTFFRAVGD